MSRKNGWNHLNDSPLPKSFQADAENIACYVMNRALIRTILKKTPYELYFGIKLNISPFQVFGCKCFVYNNGKNNLGKFDAKSNEGIFIGYSSTSKAFQVYNKRTLQVEESIHVIFNEFLSSIPRVNDYKDEENTGLLPNFFGAQQVKEDSNRIEGSREEIESNTEENTKVSQQEKRQKAWKIRLQVQ